MSATRIARLGLAHLILITVFSWLACCCSLADRQVMCLDGSWGIAEGSLETLPTVFDHQVPVPGLVDMAEPPFQGVGEANNLRQAFWYHTTFVTPERAPDVVTLKIHKAAFGSQVFLNGKAVGEHPASFTPGHFNLKPHLAPSGRTNDLVIRVRASRDAVPKGVPAGWDFEKRKYIPGLFDSVEIIVTDSPHIVVIQTAPDITNNMVRVQASIKNTGPRTTSKVQFSVREAKSQTVVGTVPSQYLEFPPGTERLVEAWVPISKCRLWSPEDPFLYEVIVKTSGDELSARFGMREFHFDPTSGRAYLNGRPYYLRGSNVTLYRFFEDDMRGDRPWREEWVRRLHRKFKYMHWNALRYCIGFPPEMWYRIADEEGILIQDEFPLWHLGEGKNVPNRVELAQEYAEWMRERWNHPSVVIWDAQNETTTEETGAAIQSVRKLDLSRRPWDNGWGQPQAPGDCWEAHPYMASNPHFRLEDMARQSGIPGGNPIPNTNHNANIINEYGWMWLNRDGSPTTLSRDFYQNQLGSPSTATDRWHLYARYLAAKTEFWRAHRACAGVLHFCGLGYSRPDGQTSDHFSDLEQLTFEPEFERYVRDAFAPTGLMIDFWAEELKPGENRALPVVLLNDRDVDWAGRVQFHLLRQEEVLKEQSVLEKISALGTNKIQFTLEAPVNPGKYTIEVALLRQGEEPVRSYRDFEILTPEQKANRHGIAVGKSATASSEATRDGVTYYATNAVDGLMHTRWSSEFSDTQWLAVDLGERQRISRVLLQWENAYGKRYLIETSLDGQVWTTAKQIEDGNGGTDDLRFPPVEARWVRFRGLQRATEYGYSLWEMQIFR